MRGLGSALTVSGTGEVTGQRPFEAGDLAANVAMDLVTAILLGLVQGITEWLPVSSSGHLIIFENLTGEQPPVGFDIALHLGTLVVVVVFFWRDLMLVSHEFFRGLGAVLKGQPLSEMLEQEPHMHLGLAVIVGTIPTVILGLGAAIYLEDQLRSLTSVGVALMVTGGWLTATRRPTEERKTHRVTLKDGLLIGLAQGLAVVPGISRSGATIATGLLSGLEGEVAARLSFLLFIPAILGAALLSLQREGLGALDSEVGYPALLAGTLTAMVVGALCLKLLMVLIHRRVLHHFAPYCLLAGALVTAWGVGLLG